MLVALLSLFCLTSPLSSMAHAQAPYAVLMVDNVTEDVPISCNFNISQAAKSLGVTSQLTPEHVTAAQEMSDGTLVPILCQYDLSADEAQQGVLSVMPKKSATSKTRIRVYFTADSPATDVPGITPLAIVQENGQIVIGNRYLKVTHDATKMGGLPSRIEWPQTGKIFENFNFNDRIHSTEFPGFSLRNDKQPQVELIAAGPVRAVVRVTARYINESGVETPSGATATYEWSYYADSPLVQVSLVASQVTRQRWDELHLIEINFPDEDFTGWAQGTPLKQDKFKAEQKGFGGASWGALTDNSNVLAILDPAFRFYDGRGEYGTYIHGPWLSWDTRKMALKTFLWIGNTEDFSEVIAMSPVVRSTSQASITTPPFEAAVSELNTTILSMPQNAERGRCLWILEKIRRQANLTGNITEATRQITDMRAALVSGKSVTSVIPWFNPTAQNDFLMLDNGKVGLVLERNNDGLGLVSLFDMIAGREMLAGNVTPLWSANARIDKEEVTFDSTQGWGQVEVNRLPDETSAQVYELTWDKSDKSDVQGVSVILRLTLESSRVSCKLKINNASAKLTLMDAYSPCIDLNRLGEDAEDDNLIYPMGSGILVKAPLIKGFNNFDGLYPSGWSSMQFASYYDPQGGLYFASHDPEAWPKYLGINNVNNSLRMQVRWIVPNATIPGNSFEQSGETALEVFNGDWFDASMIYKQWVRANAGWWPEDESRPDTPQWFKDIAVWACDGDTAPGFAESVQKFSDYMGVPTAVHWYSWHQIPFDVEYPHYFPVKDGFLPGVDQLQAGGVRIMPYINGRLWDTGLEDWKNGANASGTKDVNGNPYIEEYGSGAKLNPMCPTTELWQSKVQEIVMRLTGEYKVDGVYIDQVAAASPAPCYDPTHGHTLGGGDYWTVGGYWPLLAELRKQIKDRGPEKFLTTECNGEAYIKYFDGYLTWHFQYQGQVPMFAAIYNGRIQPFSRAYGGDEIGQIMKCGESFVFGEQLGWSSSDIISVRPALAAFMRQCAVIRYELRDCMSTGEMVRPPKLTGENPEMTSDWGWGGPNWMITTASLRSGAFRSTEGKVAVVFANVSEKPVTMDWVFDGAEYGFNAGTQLNMVEHTIDGAGVKSKVEAKFNRIITIPGRTAMAYVFTK